MQELRICPYEYLQFLRQAIPSLYRNGWTIKAVPGGENHHFGLEAVVYQPDGKETGKTRNSDRQKRKAAKANPKGAALQVGLPMWTAKD